MPINSTEFEIACMQAAIDEMVAVEGDTKAGAVAVVGEQIVAKARRGNLGSGQVIHAEERLLEILLEKQIDLKTVTVYTTLEPCIDNNHNCAQKLKDAEIKEVVIGRYDKNPKINREGWKILSDAQIPVRDFDKVHRDKIDEINSTFQEYFTKGFGPENGANFDYEQNGGNFDIFFSETDERFIRTRWTRRGKGSIYAYASKPVEVALAKHAMRFSQIHDPTALDFTYTVPVKVDEIAVFKNEDGCVVIRVQEVKSGNDWGDDRTSLKIYFQVRPCGDQSS